MDESEEDINSDMATEMKLKWKTFFKNLEKKVLKTSKHL